MNAKTILAISRLSATLDVESAKIEAGPGDHELNETITITGNVRLGEGYVSENTSISWPTVVGYLLANMGEDRAVIRRRLIEAIRRDDLASLDTGVARRQRRTFRNSVAKVRGMRQNAGKLTGKVEAK